MCGCLWYKIVKSFISFAVDQRSKPDENNIELLSLYSFHVYRDSASFPATIRGALYYAEVPQNFGWKSYGKVRFGSLRSQNS